MQKNIVIVTLLAFLMLALVSGVDAVSWQSDLDSALDKARSSGDPIMVDFYTDWCHWCKKMDSDTYSDSKVNELSKDFICVQIDADRDKAVASKYSVRGYPTVIFIDSTGSVMQVVTGYRRPDVFAATMESVLRTVESKRPKPTEQAAKSPSVKTAIAPRESAAVKKPDAKADIREAALNLQKKLNKIRDNNMELNGIIYDKICPRAIINNTIVKVGDIIEGAKVMRIEKSAVMLSLRDKVINLKLD